MNKILIHAKEHEEGERELLISDVYMEEKIDLMRQEIGAYWIEGGSHRNAEEK